jgi:preprotein translocase subunit SecG
MFGAQIASIILKKFDTLRVLRYNKIMNILFSVFKFIHYAMCVGLVFVILLQTAKSGGMAGIFGASGSDQIFNAPSRVAFIKKVTVFMACIFLFTSLMLTKLSPAVSVVS